MAIQTLKTLYTSLFVLVFFHNAVPFVGFGFFDNAIMIAAVSHLDTNLYIYRNISSIAAMQHC